VSWTENLIVRSIHRAAAVSYRSTPWSVAHPTWVDEVLDQCLHALSRLGKLFRWLQALEVVSDHFVIFRINSQHQVEAVQAPLSLITGLLYRILNVVSSGAYDDSADVRELGTAASDVLRLFSERRNVPESLQEVVDNCALAVQALCVATLSFGQAHIDEVNPFFLEHSLSQIILRGAHTESTSELDWHDEAEMTSSKPLYFQLVDLTCAGDMIESKVIAFADRIIHPEEAFDLSITPEDLLDLWGLGDFLYHQPSRPEAIAPSGWLWGITFRSGVIYKPYEDSSKMHWKAGTVDYKREGVAFELNMQATIIIGAIFVKQNCPTEPGLHNTVSRTHISSDIKELGTWPAKWDLRERQGGLQGGQFLNATFNATWIKSDCRTRKRKGLEEVDLDFLDQPWGLLVSLCTGVAQRVVLREVVAEVMRQMTDGWMEKPLEWQTLMSRVKDFSRSSGSPHFAPGSKR
jgi:hypothetical protein